MTHGSLFSGIGGFDLAAEWMQWENVFHCEWNKFGQRVLKHYWPQSISYEDITKTDFTIHRARIDVLTGGFPCQPYSTAGKRKGKDDERHLWPEMLRAIREIQPRWVVGENVRGLVNWNGGMVFDEVQFDLEAEGYEVQPFVLPAAAVNAPHRRDRVWLVAYSNHGNGQKVGFQARGQKYLDRNEGKRPTSDTDGSRFKTLKTQKSIMGEPNKSETLSGNGFESIHSRKTWQNFPTQSPICGGNDGLPSELDGITFPKWRTESIMAYGNAIVPQVVYQIFQAIQTYDHTRTKTNH